VGGRPLLSAARFAERLGIRTLHLHDDTTNPTASFKDRASLVAALRAREIGIDTVSCASTGNAASSLAAVAAALSIRAIIFVPEKAPVAKLTQILLYGADVYRVRGTYDDAFDLCLAASDRFGWYTRSTGVNPFTVEGKKTAAFEIAESLSWKSPDWIFIPTGDGNILGGIAKGFREMKRLGWIERLPRLVAVQAEGCAPLAEAWRRGSETVRPLVPRTVADSIAVGRPRDARRALRAIRETKGAVVTVGDREILRSIAELAAATGVFAEPSAAASLAGLRKALADQTVAPEESAVLLITGSGLKDIAAASGLAAESPLVEPTLPDLERAMQRR
jgi:threonine synthase